MGVAFPAVRGVESDVEQARKCRVLIPSRLQKNVFSWRKKGVYKIKIHMNK